MLQKDQVIRVLSQGGRLFMGKYRGYQHGIILMDVCLIIPLPEKDQKSPSGSIQYSLRRIDLPWLIINHAQIEPVTENDNMYVPYKQVTGGIIAPPGGMDMPRGPMGRG